MTNPRFIKIIKIVLWCKLVAIVLVVLVSRNIIQIGERNSKAADDAISQAEPAAGDDSGESAAQESSGEKRHGLLEGLLDLAPLDVAASKKDEIGRYLNLAERARQQVDDRMIALQKKAEQLTKVEAAIDQKLRSLDEERRFFANTIQKEKQIQEDRLVTLVELYTAMEPKKASPVFSAMDKDLVVALFKRMKQKQVTKILEGMTPEKSVELTEYFGRIGSAKEYDLLKEMNHSLRMAFHECKGLPSDEGASPPSPPALPAP